jgi:3-phosphoshikimate 1-carboxyvinyltransferase
MQAAAQPGNQGRADNGWEAPQGSGPVHATIPVPGSKSITNRALIIAALADGPTTITGPLQARDTDLMADAITALGASLRRDGATWTLTPGWTGETVSVHVGNAGTVLRFVPPLAALAKADVRFSGDPRASERPVGQILNGLRQLGVEIDDDGRDAVPFTVRGRGGVRGGTVMMDASDSSQFISGIMLAASRFDSATLIQHTGERIPSAPHIAMTIAMLTAAGARIEAAGSAVAGSGGTASWRVLPATLNPAVIAVEPDLSNAAPFLAAALVTGGDVTIPGWPEPSLQAARPILEVLTEMGATTSVNSAGLRIQGTGRIRGIRADLRDISELTPVLTALAALADSPSEFSGIAHLRLHESDRLAALAAEFGALGGNVTELADGLHVEPRPLRAGDEPFDTHDDHRLVMGAAVLGLAVPGMRVHNAGTVAKTFPGFTGLWQQMLEHPS